MTSNIKKMYILLIVVLLKTCKRSRGEKKHHLKYELYRSDVLQGM